ncbi:MAG TPA: ABC-2 family transporter protein [Anaeromyxobacter sp.]|nr:ABC-2 family transporter protein [Anaeromyxobacter sp.]
MLRYLRLLGIQVRASLALSAQYRLEFLVSGLLSLFWTLLGLVPILVLFRDRRELAGWSYPETLVVMGWFALVKGILEGAVSPSLTAVVDHIRKGTLDFVLLKPADAQFLVSTARFEPWRVVDILAGLAILAVAFQRMGRTPGPLEVLLAGAVLWSATVILYSLWILVVSAAFFVVKVDNLSFLFLSLYDAARWPADVFPAVLRVVFTFVIPLAVLTTIPARALLGRIGPVQVLATAVGAAAFAFLARRVWLSSIGRYTSASS